MAQKTATMVPRTSLNEAQAMVGRKEYHEAIAKLLLGKDKLTSPGKADLGQASCDDLLTSTYKTLTSDHYLALKVAQTATAKEIKLGYRKLSLKFHPDKSGGDTAELFHILSNAYQVLSDEKEKAKYDRGLQRTRERQARGSQNDRKRGSAAGGASARDEKENSAPFSSRPSYKGYTEPPAPPKPQPLNPTKPHSVRATNVDHESVTLMWVCNERMAPVTFELQIRLVHELGWPKSSQPLNSYACRKKNLQPNTAYQFRVRSVFANGNASAWSTHVTVCTTSAVPKSPDRKPGAASSSSSGASAPPPPPPSYGTGRKDYKSAAEKEAQAARERVRNQRRHSANPVGGSSSVPPPPPPSSAGGGQAGWDCAVCSRDNKASAQSCRVCGAKRNYKKANLDHISEAKDAKIARENAAKAHKKKQQEKADARTGGGASTMPPPPPSSQPSAKERFERKAKTGGYAPSNMPPPPPSSTSSSAASDTGYSYVYSGSNTPRESTGPTAAKAAKATAQKAQQDAAKARAADAAERRRAEANAANANTATPPPPPPPPASSASSSSSYSYTAASAPSSTSYSYTAKPKEKSAAQRAAEAVAKAKAEAERAEQEARAQREQEAKAQREAAAARNKAERAKAAEAARRKAERLKREADKAAKEAEAYMQDLDDDGTGSYAGYTARAGYDADDAAERAAKEERKRARKARKRAEREEWLESVRQEREKSKNGGAGAKAPREPPAADPPGLRKSADEVRGSEYAAAGDYEYAEQAEEAAAGGGEKKGGSAWSKMKKYAKIAKGKAAGAVRSSIGGKPKALEATG